MAPMTYAVMKQALTYMRDWQKDGLIAKVAVNVSPRLLNDVTLPDEFAAMAERYGVDCSRIIIEITEAAVMEETIAAMDILTRFRLKGFRLSLDDFGTGFSSLVRLYRMPFSELKIDQSFVHDIAHSEEARVIVRAIANLGHDLNLSVCAEGVENAAAQDFVTECKCESMQGYFFSLPIPGEDIPAFFGHKTRHVG
jgi:EAL domain-containing protein (putative c-di-GMP-specific phosphodiesterase class I)